MFYPLFLPTQRQDCRRLQPLEILTLEYLIPCDLTPFDLIPFHAIQPRYARWSLSSSYPTYKTHYINPNMSIAITHLDGNILTSHARRGDIQQLRQALDVLVQRQGPSGLDRADILLFAKDKDGENVIHTACTMDNTSKSKQNGPLP